MFEGFLEKFLLKYFGEYLQGIDKSNLSVAVWRGEITVKTVNINPEVIKKLNIPLSMTHGRVQGLLMKVPWNHLSSKPVEVSIDSITVVLKLEDVNTWFQDLQYQQYCEAILLQVKDEFTRKLEDELENQQKKGGFFSQIFDNITVVVKNIHVRLESEEPVYCFGAALEGFEVKSVNEAGKPAFFKRQTNSDRVSKLICLKNLRLYHSRELQGDRTPSDTRQVSSKEDMLRLDVDLLFTLSPYAKEQPEHFPVYKVSSEIHSIELRMATDAIKDLSNLADFFKKLSNAKLDFVQRQKYNYLKPQNKIKGNFKTWWKFAIKATIMERRSRMSGMVLANQPKEKKLKDSQRLKQLLFQKSDNKLTEETENELNYLTKSLPHQELIRAVKEVVLEQYKVKNKKVQLSVEDVNYFSIHELPKTFVYAEAIVLISSSRLVVDNSLSLELSGTSVEYRACDAYNEQVLSVEKISMKVDNEVLLSSSSEHQSGNSQFMDRVSNESSRTSRSSELLHLFIRSEEGTATILGKIRRIFVYYKSEILSHVNKFMDTFEDSMDFNSTLTGTKDLLKERPVNSRKGDVVNVSIEAPVFIIPESTSLWVADLGVFNILKNGKDTSSRRDITSLEIKETKLFFGERNSSFSNLNNSLGGLDDLMKIAPGLKLVVSDLHFGIDIGKQMIEGSKEVYKSSIKCDPFMVDLTAHSMQSFYRATSSLFKDTSQERRHYDKVTRRAEYSTTGELEYHVGYQIWQSGVAVIDNNRLHVFSTAQKTLGNIYMGSINELELDEKQKLLQLRLKHRTIEFKSDSIQVLTELKFKLSQCLEINKSKEAGHEGVKIEEPPSTDYAISIELKAVELSIREYHSTAVDFSFSVSNFVYSTVFINGEENGSCEFSLCQIEDRKEAFTIVTLKPQNSQQEDGKAVDYKYKYLNGQLDSTIQVMSINGSYKSHYVESLILLAEFILELVNSNKDRSQDIARKVEAESQGKKISTSLVSSTQLTIFQTQLDLYYKNEIKSIELVVGKIAASATTKKGKKCIMADLTGLGLYDLYSYPVIRDLSTEENMRHPMLTQSKTGVISLTLETSSNKSSLALHATGLDVTYVNQRFMRLVDFFMFQVMEIFYPSMVSLSKHYSREQVIEFVLGSMNQDEFLKMNISLGQIRVKIPSTTAEGVGLTVKFEESMLSNDRRLIPKVVNLTVLAYFPWEGLISEIWSVGLRGAVINILQKGEEIPSSLPFDIDITVDMLKNLFELGFLYDIHSDLRKMEPKVIESLKSSAISIDSVRENSPRRQKKLQEVILKQKEQFLALDQSQKKQILKVDGRIHVNIKLKACKIYLSNSLLQKITEVTTGNLSFDDGMDKIMRHNYTVVKECLATSVNIMVEEVNVAACDTRETQAELFSIVLRRAAINAERTTDFVTKCKFEAEELSGQLGDSIEVPAEYKYFFLEADLSQSQIMNNGKKVWGHFIQTPDLKKDVEIVLEKSRIISFSFLLRFIPELFGLQPALQHPGFEDVRQSSMSFLLRLPEAEMCFPTGGESCLVATSTITYHQLSDSMSSKQVISLGNLEMIDCNQSVYIKGGLTAGPRRRLSKPFDINLVIRSGGRAINEVNVASGPILAKLTAYNIRTAIEVLNFQKTWATETKYRSLDPRAADLILDSQMSSPVSSPGSLDSSPSRSMNLLMSFEGVSLVYIDDHCNKFQPLFRLDAKIRELTFNRGAQSNGETYVELEAHYKNYRTGNWEPLIEPTVAELLFNSNDEVRRIQIGCGIKETDEGLYLNFSEELLEAITYFNSGLNRALSVSEMSSILPKAEEIHDGEIIIRNNSGYDIWSTLVGDKRGNRTVIPNSQELFMSFPLADEFCQREPASREVIFGFENGIASGDVKNTQQFVFQVDKLGEKTFDLKCGTLCVVIKKEKLKRIAEICGLACLTNSTSLPLQAYVFGAGGNLGNFDLKSDEKEVPIPFDQVNCLLAVGLKSSLSNKVKVAELLNSPHGTRTLPLICARESYNHLQLETVDRSPGIEIRLKPALKAFNYTPVPIEFSIQSGKYGQEGLLFRGKPAEIFQLNPYETSTNLTLIALDIYKAEVNLRNLLKESYTETIRLHNMENPTQKIYLKLKSIPQKSMLVIYSKLNILNETSLPLSLYSLNAEDKSGSSKMPASGEGTVFFETKSDHDTFVINLQQKALDKWEGAGPVSNTSRCLFPKKINCIVTPGISGGQDRTYFETTLVAIPQVIELPEGILSKTISIVPKYLVLNETEFNLIVIQMSCNNMIEIPPKGRLPMIWRSREHKLSFQISKPGAKTEYMYTDFFEVDTPSFYEVYTEDTNKENREYLRIQNAVKDSITYFTVESVAPQALRRRVSNQTPFELTMKSMHEQREPLQTFAPGTVQPYSLAFPEKMSVLTFSFIPPKSDIPVTMEINCSIPSSSPTYMAYEYQGKRLRTQVTFKGRSIEVEIALVSIAKLTRARMNAKPPFSVRVAVNKLGLSAMRLIKSKRIEVINVTLSTLAFELEMKEGSIRVNTCLENIQVDNTSSNKTSLPVVFSKAPPAPGRLAEESQFILQATCCLISTSSSENWHIKEAAVVTSPVEVFLEEEYLDSLRDYEKVLWEVAANKSKRSNTMEDFIIEKYYSDFQLARAEVLSRYVWDEKRPDSGRVLVFIEGIAINNFTCLVSYFQDASETVKKDFEISSLLGVAVGGFEDALVKIDPYRREAVYLPANVFLNNFTSHYKSQALKAAYGMIGSLNILGNPAKIAREFSGGMDALIADPDNSSLTTFTKGAGVIAKGTLAGVFGGLHHTTGSLAGVFTLLSADQQFMKERGRRRNKRAENVLQGAHQGAISLVSGVADGITGVVLQPFKGAKKEGVSGFFKGVGKGLSGLVTKPVSGVLDSISKAAEGIQSQASSNKRIKMQRARNPRAFYTSYNSLRPYSPDDAVFYQALKSCNSRKDALELGISSLVMDNRRCYMALTTEYISVIDEKEKTIQFPIHSVTRCTRPNPNMLSIEYSLQGRNKSIMMDAKNASIPCSEIVSEIHRIASSRS